MLTVINIYILVIVEMCLLGSGYGACPANPPAEGRILCPGALETTTEEQCIEFAFDCCWENTTGSVSCHLNTDTANSSVNNYYHIPNTALNDPDLSVSTAATAEVCAELCDNTQFCAATRYSNICIYYRSSDESCALKSRITSIGEVGASDYDLYIQRHLTINWAADRQATLYADGINLHGPYVHYGTNMVTDLPTDTKLIAFVLYSGGSHWGLKTAYNTGWVTGDAGYWKCTSDSSLITSGWAEWGSYDDSVWEDPTETSYDFGTYMSATKPIWIHPFVTSIWCRHHLMEQAPDICQLKTAMCGSKAKCVRVGAFSFKCIDMEIVVASPYSHWKDNKALLFDQNNSTCVSGGLGALRPHFRIHKAVDVVAPDCTVTMIGNQLTCSQLEDMYVYTGNIENMDTTVGSYRECVLSTSVEDANNAALYTACSYTCAGECTAIVFNLIEINDPRVEICEIIF